MFSYRRYVERLAGEPARDGCSLGAGLVETEKVTADSRPDQDLKRVDGNFVRWPGRAPAARSRVDLVSGSFVDAGHRLLSGSEVGPVQSPGASGAPGAGRAKKRRTQSR